MKTISGQNKAYKVLSIVILVILAILFLFPLYWIVTGAFKPATDIYATKPVWAPSEWVSTNFENLFNRRSAPLFEIFGLQGPMAYQHRIYGGGGYDPYLHYRCYGRLRFG